jgi:integrase
MPRPRLKANSGLPKRWRFKNGAYRFQVPEDQRARWEGKVEFRLGATLEEAYKVWADRIGEQARVTTVSALIDRYLLEVSPLKKPASQAEDKRIAPILRKRFGLAAVAGPGSPEPQHVYQYVSKRVGPDGKLALSRAHREMAMFSHLFTYAVQWGLRGKHPFKDEVRFERALQPKRKERYVEDWEIIEALSLPAYRKRGSVLMCQAWIRLKLANVGIRATDMHRLRVSDANAEGFTVRPSKTENSTGRVQFFKWTPERKRAWEMAIATRPLDIGPYLFCNSDGDSYLNEETGRATGFDSIWQRFMDRVLKETKVTRRFAERHLRNKVGSDQESIERAQRILGHADQRVTETFYRLKPEVIE